MMSIPHLANNQGLVMIVRSCAGTLDTGACHWQWSHFLTLPTASTRMLANGSLGYGFYGSTYPIIELCQDILSLLASKALKVGPVQGPLMSLKVISF